MINLKKQTINTLRELRDSYRGQETQSTEDSIVNPSKETIALHDFVNSLDQQEFIELAAVLWLGRGDFADFSSAKAYGEGEATSTDGLRPNYVIGKLISNDYLDAGIKKLADEGIELS